MTTIPGDRDTTEWRLDANCRTADPELFFPVADRAARRRPQVREAARYCQDCPVIRECLTDAIERGEKWAVRAGLDFAIPSQRRRAAELVGGTPPDSRAQASFTRRQLRRAERVEIDGKMVHPQADHGTIHGYRTYECRCTPCSDANSRLVQLQRAASRAA